MSAAFEDEHILVIVNLSRFPQAVELDLAEYAGWYPEEMFGKNRFPAIKAQPYVFTAGSHSYFWFLLHQEESHSTMSASSKTPELEVRNGWGDILKGRLLDRLEKEILPSYLARQRWFVPKGKISGVTVLDVLDKAKRKLDFQFLLLEVKHTSGLQDIYFLPVALYSIERLDAMMKECPEAVIAVIRGKTAGVLMDGCHAEGVRRELFSCVLNKRSLRALKGTFEGSLAGKYLSRNNKNMLAGSRATLVRVNRHNTALSLDDKHYLTLFRMCDFGTNPNAEVVSFLSRRTMFNNFAPLVGLLEYRSNGESIILGMAQEFVASTGNAWTYTLGALKGYFEMVLLKKNKLQAHIREVLPFPLERRIGEVPDWFAKLIGGGFRGAVERMGVCTARMHRALAEEISDPAFMPEPFTLLFQRSMRQSLQNRAKRVFMALKRRVKHVPPPARARLEGVIKMEKSVLEAYSQVSREKLNLYKTRIHGDYNLTQLLCTGQDFTVIGFGGRPSRTQSERRLKQSPIRDVAGLIRSFHYAAYTALRNYAHLFPHGAEEEGFSPWADVWYKLIVEIFLKSYLDEVESRPVLAPRQELKLMAKVMILDEAMGELDRETELNSDNIAIPILAIEHVINGG